MLFKCITPFIFRYIYCDEALLTNSNVMGVLCAAKIYNLPTLTKECRKFLMEHMCHGNVCTILEQSILNSEDQLVEKCLKFIAPIVESVFSTKDFLSLSRPALKSLLQSNFYCDNEVKVYEACLQWAKEQCKKKQIDCTDENLRSVLGDAIYQIRFTSMQNAEFAQVARQNQILTDKEKLHICLSRISDGTTREELIDNSLFNHQQRSPSLIVFDRFTSVETDEEWDYNDLDADAIAFKSNRDIRLVAYLFLVGQKGLNIW